MVARPIHSRSALAALASCLSVAVVLGLGFSLSVTAVEAAESENPRSFMLGFRGRQTASTSQSPQSANGSLAARRTWSRRRSGELQNESIRVGSDTRTYLVHEPASRDRSQPAPLVFLFHGGGGTGRGMVKLARGIIELSDREGFAVVFPDGIGRHWNDGRPVNKNDHDDIGFISSLIDKLVGERNIDPGRVYAAGISNGGFFSQALALNIPEKLAAIASVAATVPVDWTRAPAAQPHQPMPILYMLGTEDPLVPWAGGNVGGRLFKNRGDVIPAESAVKFWVRIDRAAPDPVVTPLPDSDTRDRITETRRVYAPSAGGADVVVYELQGGGHTWPGGLQYLPAAIVGRTCRDIDANQIIWEFFKNHRRL